NASSGWNITGPRYTESSAAVTTTAALPHSSGTTTRRTSTSGSDSVIDADMSTMAATGDMVRPADARIATAAPTSSGSMPAARAGSTKKTNSACVVAMPEPHTTAKP